MNRVQQPNLFLHVELGVVQGVVQGVVLLGLAQLCSHWVLLAMKVLKTKQKKHTLLVQLNKPSLVLSQLSTRRNLVHLALQCGNFTSSTRSQESNFLQLLLVVLILLSDGLAG